MPRHRCFRLGRYLIAAAVVLFLQAIPTLSQAGQESFLEMTVGKNTYRGKLVARDRHTCWLMDRDGQLNSIKLKSVDLFGKISPQFEGLSPGRFRDKLLHEFGNKFEVVGTRHYLVCAARGAAEPYASLFEDLYRTFHVHFSTRGFEMTEPEFPLVAVVYPDRQQFASACQRDGITFSSGLRGYYLFTSNRVLLYGISKTSAASDDRERSRIGFHNPFANEPTHRLLRVPTASPTSAVAFRGIADELKGTVIHEATHQVAFNTGLHNRVGRNPLWVVEGMATVFEAPGIRDRHNSQSISSRINRERFIWFRNFIQERREPKSLSQFLGGDTLFQTAALDAYSQAWALTFFLMETRSSQYARYLRTLAGRDPLKPYPAETRIDDFKREFGSDLDSFETEFLRYATRLQVKGERTR